MNAPRIALGGAVFTFLVPAVAAACPVCFAGGSVRVLEMYYMTTAFLSVLPLVFLASVTLWLRYRFRRLKAQR